MSKRQPMQPVVEVDGVIRFKENKIVRDLLNFASPLGMSLNQIAIRDYSQEDREQFAQLIGYSICGFHELSEVSDLTADMASVRARKINPKAGGCRDEYCAFHSGVKRQK